MFDGNWYEEKRRAVTMMLIVAVVAVLVFGVAGGWALHSCSGPAASPAVVGAP